MSHSRSIWDWLKCNIRAHTIQPSERRAREKNERKQNFQEEYAKAKFTFETDPNDQNANTFDSAKDPLELFYEVKVRGTMIRAQARWHMHTGRKVTHPF